MQYFYLKKKINTNVTLKLTPECGISLLLFLLSQDVLFINNRITMLELKKSKV